MILFKKHYVIRLWILKKERERKVSKNNLALEELNTLRKNILHDSSTAIWDAPNLLLGSDFEIKLNS